MSEGSTLLFKLYTSSRSKQRHISFQSTIAEQLCVRLTENKSQEDRMGSMCFKTFCWAQTVTYRHMWAKSDSWHVFCMVIMWSTFSRSGWHAESQETADDEGLGLGQGNGADWALLHQGRGELWCSTYQQPDAQPAKSPPFRRQMTLHYVWKSIKICQCISIFLSWCCEMFSKRHSTKLWYECNTL